MKFTKEILQNNYDFLIHDYEIDKDDIVCYHDNDLTDHNKMCINTLIDEIIENQNHDDFNIDHFYVKFGTQSIEINSQLPY